MFEGRFEGQVAVITGGASGIGRGIGLRLAREGAIVSLWDRNEAALSAALQDAEAAGLRVDGMTVDVTDPAAIENAVAQVAEAHGRLDIAVNSAGIVGLTNVKITEFPVDVFDVVINVNLRGAFLLTKYALPHMLKRNYGRILHLASMSGKDGNPGMIGYTTSKAGVIGLVKAVGKEYAETGVTINGIAPAVIATPMNAATDPEQLKWMTDKIPMKRLGTIEEVAALAAWILSPEATFNTACIFDLSGGRAVY